jgi:hypothetical protein
MNAASQYHTGYCVSGNIPKPPTPAETDAEKAAAIAAMTCSDCGERFADRESIDAHRMYSARGERYCKYQPQMEHERWLNVEGAWVAPGRGQKRAAEKLRELIERARGKTA